MMTCDWLMIIVDIFVCCEVLYAMSFVYLSNIFSYVCFLSVQEIFIPNAYGTKNWCWKVELIYCTSFWSVRFTPKYWSESAWFQYEIFSTPAVSTFRSFHISLQLRHLELQNLSQCPTSMRWWVPGQQAYVSYKAVSHLELGLPNCFKLHCETYLHDASTRLHVYFLFIFKVCNKISELPWMIIMRLCCMIGIWVRFIILVPKFGYHLPKKIWDQKHAKFWAILCNFKLWSWMSSERVKISKTIKTCDWQRFLPH